MAENLGFGAPGLVFLRFGTGSGSRRRRWIRQKANPAAAMTPRGTPTPIPIFAEFVSPVEGVGVGDEVVESDELYVDEEADVDHKVDVVRVVADGDVVNVAGAGRPGVMDEINLGDGVEMTALETDGVVVTDVVVEGTVADDVAVVVEEIDTAIELRIVAARLMPFLSVQQVALVLPQHQVPSPHCFSPMLPEAPCRCTQDVSLRCLFSREATEHGPK